MMHCAGVTDIHNVWDVEEVVSTDDHCFCSLYFIRRSRAQSSQVGLSYNLQFLFSLFTWADPSGSAIEFGRLACSY